MKSSSYDEMKEIQELLMKLKQKLPNVGDGIDELEFLYQLINYIKFLKVSLKFLRLLSIKQNKRFIPRIRN